MVKLMIVMHRRPDLTVEAFRRHLWEIHLPIVARLPGVRRVVVNLPLPAPDGDGSAQSGPDGFGQDWFDSLEDLQAALASPVGQEAAADGPNYLDLERTQLLIMDEAEVPLPALASGY